MSSKFNLPQIISLQQMRTLSKEDMLLYFSPLLLWMKLCTLSMRILYIFNNFMKILSHSSFSPKMLVLDLKKSKCSMSHYKVLVHSIHWLSNSWKFWLRIRDLSILALLLRDIKDFINNLIKKKRSQLSLLSHFLLLRRQRFLQL